MGDDDFDLSHGRPVSRGVIADIAGLIAGDHAADRVLLPGGLVQDTGL